MYDPSNDAGPGASGYDTQPTQNWWEGPPPPGYTGPWPPPLPPGASYGPTPGSINYAPGTNWTGIPGWSDPGQPGIDPAGGPTYNPNPATPPTPPAPSSGGGGGGGGGGSHGSLTDPFPGQFTAPTPQYPLVPPTPVFTPPGYTKPPAFQEPTLQDAMADPGYEFARSQGENALLANRAMRGILGTGGALKDLAAWNQDYATQRYGDVYNRKRDVYNLNYTTQYTDPFNFAYRGAMDAFQPQMTGYTTQAQAGQRANELDYNHAWDRFMQDYNSWKDSRNFKWDTNFQLATS